MRENSQHSIVVFTPTVNRVHVKMVGQSSLTHPLRKDLSPTECSTSKIFSLCLDPFVITEHSDRRSMQSKRVDDLRCRKQSKMYCKSHVKHRKCPLAKSPDTVSAPPLQNTKWLSPIFSTKMLTLKVTLNILCKKKLSKTVFRWVNYNIFRSC